MPVVRFLGRIFPEHVQINAGHGGQLDWANSVQKASFRVEVSNSQVTVRCEAESFGSESILSTLYNQAFHVARSMIDLLAFSYGDGLTVVLDKMIDVDGSVKNITITHAYLRPLCTAFSPGDASFSAVQELVLQDADLAMALGDLIVGLTIGRLTVVNCARALETLRCLISADDNRGRAWDEFQAALNITKEYRQFVTDHSTGVRHGRRDLHSAELKKEVCIRTWTMMNRFLEYRKRGNQQLPISEFPHLVH